MSTFSQLTKKSRPKRVKKNKHLLFRNRPQKRVTCLNVLEMAPRKPNSAKRNIADVFWFQKPKFKLKRFDYVKVKVLVPGQAKQVYPDMNKPKKRPKADKNKKREVYDKNIFLPKRKGGKFLIQGATVKDLPRVKYKIIRQSVPQRTLIGLYYRRTARSKYGNDLYGGKSIKPYGERDLIAAMDSRKWDYKKARKEQRLFKYRNFKYR